MLNIQSNRKSCFKVLLVGFRTMTNVQICKVNSKLYQITKITTLPQYEYSAQCQCLIRDHFSPISLVTIIVILVT